jgi:hypothetical protein
VKVFTPLLYLNFGGNFDGGKPAYGSNDPGILSYTRPSEYSIKNAVVVDYNGDGYDDLIRPLEPISGDLPGANAILQYDHGVVAGPVSATEKSGTPVLVPDPSGFDFAQAPLVPQPGLVPPTGKDEQNKSKLMPAMAFADADGDGSPDLLQIDADGTLVVNLGEMGREHLLARVTDGIGKRIEVKYEAAQAFADGVTRPTYETYSELEVSEHARTYNRVPRLVSSYQLQQRHGAGTFTTDRTFRLRYYGACRGMYGRGWLGFDRRTVEEVEGVGGRLIREVTSGGQRNKFQALGTFFPIAGRDEFSTERSGFAQSVLEASRVRRFDTKNYEWSIRYSTAGRPFVFLDTFEEASNESPVSGSGNTSHALLRRSVIYDVDDYGNVIFAAKGVAQPNVSGSSATLSITHTSTEYQHTVNEAYADAWLVSLPRRSEVTDTVYNSSGKMPQATRLTEYGHDPEFGLLHAVVREPEDDDTSLKQVVTFERTDDLFRNVSAVVLEGSWPDEDAITVSGERRTTIEYDSRSHFPEHVRQHLVGSSLVTDLKVDPRDGRVITRVDATGVGQRQMFDGFGRALLAEDATDTVRTLILNPDAGSPAAAQVQVSTESMTTGDLSIQRIDSLGRVVQTERTGLAGKRVFQEFTYLVDDLPAAIARPHLAGDSSQGVVEYIYDDRFRLVEQAFPDGNSVRRSYASASNLTPLSNVAAPGPGEIFVTSFRDARGNRTLLYENERGDVVRSLDTRKSATYFRYEAFGVLGRIVDPAGNLTELYSDALGRLLTHQDGDTGAKHYRYTAFDEVLSSTDAEERTSVRDYDDLGRLRTLTTGSELTAFDYDGAASQNALGRLVETVSPSGHVEHYTYEPRANDPLDNRGFVTQIARTIAGQTFTTALAYNSESQLERVEYPPFPLGSRPEPADERTIRGPVRVRHGRQSRGGDRRRVQPDRFLASRGRLPGLPRRTRVIRQRRGDDLRLRPEQRLPGVPDDAARLRGATAGHYLRLRRKR